MCDLRSRSFALNRMDGIVEYALNLNHLFSENQVVARPWSLHVRLLAVLHEH